MKKLMVFLAVVSVASLSYGNGILWSGAAIDYSLNYSNGVTALHGGVSGTLGCFAQLLWVGANGLIDPAYNYGTGVGGTDDLVIDKWYVGGGDAGGADGWFTNPNLLIEGGNVVSGRTYFVRLWSAAASDYAAGTVPSSLTNKYGNSVTWTYHSILPTGDNFDAAETAALNTTLQPLAVPEPAMFGLGIVGLISIRFFGRKRK